MSKPPNRDIGAEKSQADKFRDLARELEANEDEKAFEETLKGVAVVPPVPPKEKQR